MSKDLATAVNELRLKTASLQSVIDEIEVLIDEMFCQVEEEE
jgi:hypothetical protein